MNTKQIAGAVLALCLMLAGCGETAKATLFHPEFDTEDPLPAVDVQNKYQTLFSDVLQEGETFFCGGSYVDGMLLHYYDKESGISGILCGDPSCTHETADCGAKIAMSGGVALNKGIVKALSEELKQDIFVHENCQLFGAIGAALYALEEINK